MASRFRTPSTSSKLVKEPRPTLSPTSSHTKRPGSSNSSKEIPYEKPIETPYEKPIETPYEKPIEKHNDYESANTHHHENGYPVPQKEPDYPVPPKEPTYATPQNPLHGYHPNGEIIIDESCEKEIEFKKIEIESSREDITIITTGLLDLLTIGEINHCGEIVVEGGEFFLEGLLRKFQIEFLERWKIEFLFPAIRCWLEKYIIEYILKIIMITREKIIREYEERIVIIKEYYEREMCRRDECMRKRYHEIIIKAWAEYEKSMREIEFVKEVRFKYVATEERERWGEFIKGIKELEDCVPCHYEPDWCIDDCRHGTRICFDLLIVEKKGKHGRGERYNEVDVD